VLEEVALPVSVDVELEEPVLVDVSLDELLTDLLGLVEPDTTFEFVAIGVSDCVGTIVVVVVVICDKEYDNEGETEIDTVVVELEEPVLVDVSLDELLTDVLGLVEPDTTLEVVIIGVSDCVGPIVVVAICDKEYESEGDAEVDTVDVLLTDGICVNDIREVLE
jgi:hypothetical protein